jgi:hypothetical protein
MAGKRKKPKKTQKSKTPKPLAAPRRNLDPSLPVYQLKVTLDGIDPPIWRRVQVENYRLDMLHELILELFEWHGQRRHAFYRPWLGRSRRHGEIFDDEKSVRLSDIVAENYEKFVYIYSLPDLWYHTVEIEATLPADPDVRYPRCLGGERAAPVDGCGGPRKWQSLVEAARDPETASLDDRKWIDPEAFDPETFDVEEVGRRLHRLRTLLAEGMPPSGTAVFQEEEQVRVRPGVVHPEYPDLLLGGWAGEVETIGYVTPRMYRVVWTPETLAMAHPAYARRCFRDELDPEETWLEEDQLVADPGGPVVLEEPVNFQTRPLSADITEDRIRMIFGVTSDDPIPQRSRETLSVYRRYLADRLQFPFDAEVFADMEGEDDWPVKALSLCELSQNADGLEVEVSTDDDMFTVELYRLTCRDDSHPNARLIDDYQEWFHEAGREPEWSDVDEDEEDGSEDEEYEEHAWGIDREVEDELDRYEDEDEDEDDEDGASDEPAPPARLPRGDTIGRNEPCPCGSGKKYKHCCMAKADSP